MKHEYDAPDFARMVDPDSYADEPNPNLPPPDWAWRVYAVICIALFVAALVIARGVF